MPDVDERLGQELAATGREVSLGPGFPDDVSGRVARRQRRRRALVLSSMIVFLVVGAGAVIQLRSGDDDSTEVVAGPGPDTPASSGAPGVWTPMPEGPLSPRRDALAFTVGDEALIFGGHLDPACPETSFCENPPLVDGAAYDPIQRTWRSIADMPVPIQRASGAVVGDRVYLWAQTYCGATEACLLAPFMVYDLGDDEWTRLSVPPDVSESGVRLTAFGDEIVAYRWYAEDGLSDFVYSPADDNWTALPASPAAVPTSDRTMVAHGEDLYLFGLGLSPAGAHGAAVLRAGADQWDVLDDGGDLGYGTTWAVIGDLIVSPGGPIETDPIPTDDGVAPIFGHGDGGALDTTDDTWEALPAPPADPPDFQDLGTVAGPRLIVTDGMVFDVAAGTWTPLPQTETVTGSGAAVTWVDDTLVAWGGEGLEILAIGATFTPAEVPPPPSGDAGPLETRWQRVESTDDLVDAHVINPDLVVDPDDPAVVLARFSGDTCAAVRAIVEVQDEDLIRIRVESGRTPTSTGAEGGLCRGAGQDQEIAVPLDDPVGDRALRSVPGGTTGPSWRRIEPTEDLDGARTTRVDELVADPEDESSVLAHFLGGVPDCVGARAVVERQDDDVVRIRIETGEVPGLNDGDRPDLHLCATVGFNQELVVHLDAPLGDRALQAVPAEP